MWPETWAALGRSTAGWRGSMEAVAVLGGVRPGGMAGSEEDGLPSPVVVVTSGLGSRGEGCFVVRVGSVLEIGAVSSGIVGRHWWEIVEGDERLLVVDEFGSLRGRW